MQSSDDLDVPLEEVGHFSQRVGFAPIALDLSPAGNTRPDLEAKHAALF